MVGGGWRGGGFSFRYHLSACFGARAAASIMQRSQERTDIKKGVEDASKDTHEMCLRTPLLDFIPREQIISQVDEQQQQLHTGHNERQQTQKNLCSVGDRRPLLLGADGGLPHPRPLHRGIIDKQNPNQDITPNGQRKSGRQGSVSALPVQTVAFL